MKDGKADASGLLEQAGILVDGPAPLDIQVRDPRFYGRVLRDGSLGLGEAFVEGGRLARRHYEQGLDFLSAMLDRRMVYSCGYWKDAQTRGRRGGAGCVPASRRPRRLGEIGYLRLCHTAPGAVPRVPAPQVDAGRRLSLSFIPRDLEPFCGTGAAVGLALFARVHVAQESMAAGT